MVPPRSRLGFRRCIAGVITTVAVDPPLTAAAAHGYGVVSTKLSITIAATAPGS